MKCGICHAQMQLRDDVTLTFHVATNQHTLNICGPCLRRKIGSKEYYALRYDAVRSGWVQPALPF